MGFFVLLFLGGNSLQTDRRRAPKALKWRKREGKFSSMPSNQKLIDGMTEMMKKGKKPFCIFLNKFGGQCMRH